ncbi:MAG: GNAT family N-acetyltransferase [Anaerolineaceae bacterium]
MFNRQLFEGQNIYLTAIDADSDPILESGWTMNLDYTRKFHEEPARPLAVFELHKQYTEQLKQSEEKRNEFYFAIHERGTEVLVGFIRLPHISWMNRGADLVISVSEHERKNLFEKEAITLALNFAFRELNLNRVSIVTPDYDAEAVSLYQGMGFVLEARRREAVYSRGKHWAALHFGMLSLEWEDQE